MTMPTLFLSTYLTRNIFPQQFGDKDAELQNRVDDLRKVLKIDCPISISKSSFFNCFDSFSYGGVFFGKGGITISAKWANKKVLLDTLLVREIFKIQRNSDFMVSSVSFISYFFFSIFCATLPAFLLTIGTFVYAYRNEEIAIDKTLNVTSNQQSYKNTFASRLQAIQKENIKLRRETSWAKWIFDEKGDSYFHRLLGIDHTSRIAFFRQGLLRHV